ncbi:MAG: tetratricopeptide repeat protein [Planctomycetaceae bacterium]|nr:tetratricopeptide repeat protein [Planctomycetaceae bacterium]
MRLRESPDTIRTLIVRAAGIVALVNALSAPSTTCGDDILDGVVPAAPAPDQLKHDIRRRVETDPRDAASWRLLARTCIDDGDWEGAISALERALALDDQSAAIYFDYGCAAEHLGRSEVAAAAFNNAIYLAPDSEYALGAEEHLQQLETADGIQLASYDIRSFDGSDLIPLILPRQRADESEWSDRLNVRLDLSGQYNSNVSLAPSSREINASRKASAQAAASISFAYAAIDVGGLRLGPSFDSDFTLNERNVQQYDLQSYRPGVFADGKWDTGGVTLKPRIAYTFDHDSFDGQTFGNKHSLAMSTGAVWTPRHVTTAYYAFDHNNLVNDGAAPDVSSQDGNSNTIGVVHDIVDRDWMWRSFRIGADFQNVNTRGDNFRYDAVSTYSQAVFALTSTLNLKVRSGYAYRDYMDFQGSPSRNSHIIRTGVELRRLFDHGISVAAFSHYDRFASRNSQYDRTRFLSGVVTTWEY